MRDGQPKLGKPVSVQDPLQWDNFVERHALHCTETDHDLQVHWSWFFLPWHRAYLFFLERRLASIIAKVFGGNGNDFALPYWDWERHKEIPNTKERIAKKKPSPLFGYDLDVDVDPIKGDEDPYNFALWSGYRGPTVDRPGMDHEAGGSTKWAYYVKNIRDIETSPYQIAKMLKIPSFCQFGGFSRIDRETGQGLLESGPHNSVHDWVGSRYGNNRDMGTLRYAALDPIFCLHHANIDRIWSLYPYTPDPDGQPPKDNNCRYKDDDFKVWGEQWFNFRDVDGSLVSVTVRDTVKNMNTVSYAPPSAPTLLAAATARDAARAASAPLRARSVEVSRDETKLSNRITVTFKGPEQPVARPAEVRARIAEGSPAQPVPGRLPVTVLEIEVGDFQYMGRFQVRVFVNKDDANADTLPDGDHYVGMFKVLDSHSGSRRVDERVTHMFYVNVRDEFYKVATPGTPYTITLVPLAQTDDFRLVVKSVKLIAYQ